MVKKYKLIRRDRASIKIPDHVEYVYDFLGCDYGCANDDSRMTGIEHMSVSFNERGQFFTIPILDLEERKR